MKHYLYIALQLFSVSVLGQIIEVPSGTPLTIQGNLNLNTGFSIQYGGQIYMNAPADGTANTYLRFGAGNTKTGQQNTFIGSQAGFSNTTSAQNVFVGASSGVANTTGNNNAFIGYQTGYANTTGIGNAYIGIRAGQNATTANGNTFVGGAAGNATTTGGQNTYLGQNAGFTGNATGSNNVFIGSGAGVDAAGRIVNNSVAIGANTIVTASNAVVLGNGANVGIGNSAPLAKLHLTTGVANMSGLRLENLTSASPAIVVNQTKFLSVNASGDVILASSNSSGRLGGELWTVAGEYTQSTTAGGVVIGEHINRKPSGYKLYVQEGILTEKVKVAIKTTDEWSDKVFSSTYTLLPLFQIEQ